MKANIGIMDYSIFVQDRNRGYAVLLTYEGRISYTLMETTGHRNVCTYKSFSEVLNHIKSQSPVYGRSWGR